MQRRVLKSAPEAAQTQIFCRMAKVDEANRTVFGRAVQEVPDASGEIFDYATSKPYFEKWVADTKEASGGKSLGNIRSMHGNTAAGKAVEVTFHDDECAIDIAAKIVDDNEWEKVLEGVYTGFSIGGVYVGNKRADGDLMRYTAAPVEISLVDKPCIPTAMFFDVVKSKGFDVVKADGSSEHRVYKVDALDGEGTGTPSPAVDEPPGDLPAADAGAADASTELEIEGSPEAVKALGELMGVHKLDLGKVVTMVKASVADKRFADEAQKKYPLDNADQVMAAWYFINTEKGAKGYDADTLKTVKSNIVDAYKERFGNDPEEVTAEKVASFVSSKGLAKSFWGVSSASSMMSSLCYFLEDMKYWEECGIVADGVVGQIVVCVSAMGDVITSLLQSAIDETTAEENGEVGESLAMMRKWQEGLEKIGARNSKKDIARIQGALDLLVELGGTCPVVDKGLAAPAPLGENEQLAKALSTIDEMQARLKKIEDTPRPPRAVLKVVEKSQDANVVPGTNPMDGFAPVLDSRGEVDAAATAMKMVHRLGGRNALPV